MPALRAARISRSANTEYVMKKFDRRSALTIGLAAASAAVVKPAASQTVDYKDTTTAPGVVSL
jgi:hypothetical protein